MTERDHADVKHDVPRAIQEKDHPNQEQQVVVPGDHVFGPEIQKRDNGGPADSLDKSRVGVGNGMRHADRRHA